MFRFDFSFFSKKPADEDSTEATVLLKTQPKPAEDNELSYLIAQDVKAYLAQRNLSQEKLSLWEPNNTAELLLADFQMKNKRYLEKKKAFKEHKDNSSAEYKALRKEYLDMTQAAYAAINLWLDQQKMRQEATPEGSGLRLKAFSMN